MIQAQEVAPLDTIRRKPRDDELDAYGITHRGKVRAENQDHFVIGSLRKRIAIRQSSVPLEEIPVEEERVASFMMVADGVGGGRKGEEASRATLEEVAQFITEGAGCYFKAGESERHFVKALERAAKGWHEAVRERAASDPDTV